MTTNPLPVRKVSCYSTDTEYELADKLLKEKKAHLKTTKVMNEFFIIIIILLAYIIIKG